MFSGESFFIHTGESDTEFFVAYTPAESALKIKDIPMLTGEYEMRARNLLAIRFLSIPVEFLIADTNEVSVFATISSERSAALC